MNTSGTEKTDETLRFLMDTMADVLTETGQPHVADQLPWRSGAGSTLSGFPPEVAESCVRAYSLAFQLLDQAEEDATAQARRAAEDEGRLDRESGSWAWNLSMLKERGFDQAAIASGLREVRVEPVLTAQPTEAKGAKKNWCDQAMRAREDGKPRCWTETLNRRLAGANPAWRRVSPPSP